MPWSSSLAREGPGLEGPDFSAITLAVPLAWEQKSLIEASGTE